MSDFEEFKQAEKSGWEAQGGRYHLGVEKFTTIAAPALLEMAQVGEGLSKPEDVPRAEEAVHLFRARTLPVIQTRPTDSRVIWIHDGDALIRRPRQQHGLATP